MEREITSVKVIHDSLRKYDVLAKNDDFIQVAEWVNGEGYDITLGDRVISLTDGQLDAINFLVKCLRYEGR